MTSGFQHRPKRRFDDQRPTIRLIFDPFAGGGSIPLEAQRLGLEAHASDLNPVAVLINKAFIEIPHRFRDQPPSALVLQTRKSGRGAALKYWPRLWSPWSWVRQEAQTRVGRYTRKRRSTVLA